MFELDARAGVSFGDEANLDFRIQARVVLPVGANIPGEHKSCMRLPRKHATPVTCASVIAALVPAATDARLHDGVDRIGLPDLVHGQWPPGSHLFGEDLPGDALRRRYADDLSHGVGIETARQDLLGHHDFLTLLAASSAASLKALSVSSQNPSSHRRKPSTPRVSTR